jgi:hypothetical protein
MPISQRVQHFSIYRRIHPMPRFSELPIAPFALPQCPAQFVQNLRTVCPQANTNRSAGAFLDSTANQFDNTYYKHLVEGKGVFGSDTTLLELTRLLTKCPHIKQNRIHLFIKTEHISFKNRVSAYIYPRKQSTAITENKILSSRVHYKTE